MRAIIGLLVVGLSVSLACSASMPTDDAADDTGGGYGSESALVVNSTLRATAAVNLRKGPSTSTAVIHVIPKGDTVTVVSAAPQAGFYNVKHEGVVGWVYGIYLEDVAPPPPSSTTVTGIKTIAATSKCYAYSWNDRGKMPIGFIQGVALTFAKAVCNPDRTDVILASKAKTSDGTTDALAWYASNYSGLGMSNSSAGVVTLRHVYTLLLGLGMRESSGEHCIGRDTSASNYSADSSEAGAWQTSYDSHTIHPELAKLFSTYHSSSVGCYLETYRTGVTCSSSDWKNWGAAGDGHDFQEIEKACPSFAAEYAAVMLRVAGGSKGHYGPLRTKAAELRPECDSMLQSVQRAVENDPSVCSAL
jgi:hypothetical protein